LRQSADYFEPSLKLGTSLERLLGKKPAGGWTAGGKGAWMDISDLKIFYT
jgi:hypothetical protein